MLPYFVLAFYLIINLITWNLYRLDKLAARQGRWRTPEQTLLSLSMLGGALGGLLGMLAFRHKTRKLLFWLINLAALAAHIFIIRWYLG